MADGVGRTGQLVRDDVLPASRAGLGLEQSLPVIRESAMRRRYARAARNGLELRRRVDEFARELFKLLNYPALVGGRVEKDEFDLVGPGISVTL